MSTETDVRPRPTEASTDRSGRLDRLRQRTRNKSREIHLGRKVIAGTVLLASGMFAGVMIKTELDSNHVNQQIADAHTNADNQIKEKQNEFDNSLRAEALKIEVLSYAGNTAITPFMIGDAKHKDSAITIKDNNAFVTLSPTPEAPSPACAIAFRYTGSNLEWDQSDQLGHVIDHVTVSSGQQASATLQDVCPDPK